MQACPGSSSPVINSASFLTPVRICPRISPQSENASNSSYILFKPEPSIGAGSMKRLPFFRSHSMILGPADTGRFRVANSDMFPKRVVVKIDKLTFSPSEQALLLNNPETGNNVYQVHIRFRRRHDQQDLAGDPQQQQQQQQQLSLIHI